MARLEAFSVNICFKGSLGTKINRVKREKMREVPKISLDRQNGGDFDIEIFDRYDRSRYQAFLDQRDWMGI